METSMPNDILIFSGQGSKLHLSDRSNVETFLQYLGDTRALWDLFLQQCFEEFHHESINSIEEVQSILGRSPNEFYECADALLFPPNEILSHPITETVSLYLRQILELLVFATQNGGLSHVVEATGVCTGLLPAAIAASATSYSSQEFLELALHGFRLAFWVGLRSTAFHSNIMGSQPQDSTSWVHSVFGWPTNELETALTKFRTERHQEVNHSIQIAAIFDDDVHSISGPGHVLEDFITSHIPLSIRHVTAHVHGFYHGGLRMENVVAQLLDDVQRRNINFPSWDTLQAPLRSSTTGALITKSSGPQSLLETVLRCVFVDVCDWKTTSTNLFYETATHLLRDSNATFRVLCVGPGSKSLVRAAPTHARLSIIDKPMIGNDDKMDNMIAIVGMSLNYPGAGSQEQLWEIIENAQCTATNIPSSRFDASEKLSDKLGNFLDDPFQFDSGFFNISPREARSMDPQQRLLLQAAFEALEDSGYSPDSTPTFQRESFGVFAGVATGDYTDNLRQNVDVHYSTGTLRAFLSGRISYAFGFLGPSVVIDTACSSSLVALYQALQALRSGECTAALAGGVNTISSPDMYTGLARAHFLSPNGQCKPFDASADGYCRAEGCGMVVLKRLANAIEENDHIYGVIRGIGVNQCGMAKSITHPDHTAQAALFRKIMNSSRTAPDTISVVEAHGTGTQAGDYAEVSSLSSTFGLRSRSSPLYLTSIKGNIGHAEAASGIAGLAKLLVMMRHGQIPPQASFKKLNPRFADRMQNMVVPTHLTEWKRSPNQAPRRAMLNNFGAAGSNAALILEEYIPRVQVGLKTGVLGPERSHHVLNLSAKSEQALELLQRRFVTYIANNPETNIQDLCYSVNARRQSHVAFRLSATGSRSDQLLESLRQSRIVQFNSARQDPKKTIFVFSGQGHAHKGMGAELLSTIPSFRAIVDKCDGILSKHGFPPVSPYLLGSPDLDFSNGSATEVVVTQCALFVLEFALAQTWMQWGLLPDVVVGHSIGEYAAMAVSGILDVNDALLLTARRAKLIGLKCVADTSGMVTCKSTVDEIGALLNHNDHRFEGLSIACLNTLTDIVIAGPVGSLLRFVDYCKDSGIKAKQLAVPYGFHSSAMDPMLEDLGVCASTTRLNRSKIMFGSSLYGKLLDVGERLDPGYFVRHTRDSVNFYHVIEEIQNSSSSCECAFIEIGPYPSTSMIQKTMNETPYKFLPSLKPTQSPWETLSCSLSSLFLQGFFLKWREVYSGSMARFLPITPRYPLNTSQYYIPFQNQSSKFTEPPNEIAKPSLHFLGSAVPSQSGHKTSFHTNLTPLAPYIKAHAVGGVPLCPASVLMEVALEAFSICQGISSTDVHLLENIVFEKPLVYADQSANELGIQTDIAMNVGKDAQFTLSSRDQHLCVGAISRRSPSEVRDEFTRKSTFVERQRRALDADLTGNVDSFSRKTIYSVIFPRVVTYTEPFLTLKQLSVSESRLEGCGKVQLDGLSWKDKFVCHPVFVDTLLHAPGFIANIYVPTDIACICVGIEKAYLPAAQDLKHGDYDIYCSLTDLGHSVIADTYVADPKGKVVAFIEGSCFKKIPLKSFSNHLSRSLQAPVHQKTPLQTRVAARSASMPHIEQVIQSTVQECCDVVLDPLSDIPLVEAGIDSLVFIELTSSIRKRLPQLDIDQASLERCSTLKELTEMVSPVSEKGPSPTKWTSDMGYKSPLSPKNMTSRIIRSSDEDQIFSPIRTAFTEVCGIPISPETPTQELAALGFDSLLSIEFSDELKNKFGVSIDDIQHDIPRLTLDQLEEICADRMCSPDDMSDSSESQATSDSESQSASPTPATETFSPARSRNLQRIIQRQSVGTPKCNMYLFHDGSGYCNMYSRMADVNRNITGIHSPDMSVDIRNLEDLARFYLDGTDICTDNGVVLSGWSFGGVLAFEVARMLQSYGLAVKGLILIDSPPPIKHEALPQEIVSHVLSKHTGPENGFASETSKKALETMKRRFRDHAMMLQNYQPEPLVDSIPCVMLKCSCSMDTQSLCGVTYPWISDDEFRDKSVAQWEQLVGESIPVLDIDCNHFEVFDPKHVEDVSRKFTLACELLSS
ncbi:hypothetical protein NPX13_g523 [Xylaria arbuscula]|uniref:Carrier domain-containing protein n=1 Tax=Xylaria arbuscula TaxID=114810 RepID=A0A9W8TSE6_9PEZI|nr:hypothetical protein NPX13_g523 [Xylaria arbuscula]